MIAANRNRRGGRNQGREYGPQGNMFNGKANTSNTTRPGRSRYLALANDEDEQDNAMDNERRNETRKEEETRKPLPSMGKIPVVQNKGKHEEWERLEDMDVANPRERRVSLRMDVDKEKGRKKPKQAVAQEEHTVVSSMDRGETIARTIRNETDFPLLHGLREFSSEEHHNDPPDVYEECTQDQMDEGMNTTTNEGDGNEALQGRAPAR